ncbi:MAG TPA: RidA family protein [Bryobacteraceae bacterium]|nr:RidA family protein [Bryobacteraceae bacterium]
MLSRSLRVLLLTFTLSGLAVPADKRVIAPPGTAANRPFSEGLLVGDTLYVSGKTGNTADGKIPEDFEAEVQQTLDNIGKVITEAGMSFADAVSVQVYLTDMSLFSRMNTVYMKVFTEPRPTRTTVGVAKLVGTARIEITVTARQGAKSSKKKK